MFVLNVFVWSDVNLQSLNVGMVQQRQSAVADVAATVVYDRNAALNNKLTALIAWFMSGVQVCVFYLDTITGSMTDSINFRVGRNLARLV